MSSTRAMAMRDSRAHGRAGRAGVVADGGREARSGSRRSPASPRRAPSDGICGSARPFEPATISLVVPAERRDGTPRGAEDQLPRGRERARGGGDGPLERQRRRAAARSGPGARRAADRAPRPGPPAVVAAASRRPTRPRRTCCGGCGRRRPPRSPPSSTSRRPSKAGPPRQLGVRRPSRGSSTSLPVSPATSSHAPASRWSCTKTLHGGNVLLDATRGWLAIDPKPLVGERAFDCASLVRDRRTELMRDPHPLARIRRRLDQFAEELALDRERIRGWGVVHAVAWGGEGGPGWDPAMVACAGWLADALVVRGEPARSASRAAPRTRSARSARGRSRSDRGRRGGRGASRRWRRSPRAGPTAAASRGACAPACCRRAGPRPRAAAGARPASTASSPGQRARSRSTSQPTRARVLLVGAEVPGGREGRVLDTAARRAGGSPRAG